MGDFIPGAAAASLSIANPLSPAVVRYADRVPGDYSSSEVAFSSAGAALFAIPLAHIPFQRAGSSGSSCPFSSIAPSSVGTSQGPCLESLPCTPRRLLGFLPPLWPAPPLLFIPANTSASLGALKTCLHTVTTAQAPCLSFKRHHRQRARRAHFTRGTVSPLHPPAFRRACRRSQVLPGPLTQPHRAHLTLVDSLSGSSTPAKPFEFCRRRQGRPTDMHPAV
jgi:hypothetical protein